MYIDIAIILILLISIYRGYKKGLIKSVFRFLFTIGALVASYLYLPKAIEFFDNHTTMRSALTDFMLRYVRNRVQITADSGATDQMPSMLSSYLDSGSLIMTNAMVAPLVDRIIHVVAFLLLFIAFRFVLKLIEIFMYRVLLKTFVMRSINKGLGVALGVIRGVLTSYLLILALLVIGVLGNITPVMNSLNHSLATGICVKTGLLPFAEEFLDPPTMYKSLDLSSMLPLYSEYAESEEDYSEDEYSEEEDYSESEDE